MKKFVAIGLLSMALTGACSSEPSKPAKEESLNETCVRETAALYKAHNLPTTHPASEWPAICDQYMADHNITTKAQLVIALRMADKELSSLEK